MLIGEKKLKKNTEEWVNKPSALRDKHNIEALSVTKFQSQKGFGVMFVS